MKKISSEEALRAHCQNGSALISAGSVKKKTYGKVVVLFEDNVVNEKQLSKMLTDFGCIVYAFGDGKNAAAICSIIKPDLVLMDLVMPVVDGIEATQDIRSSDKEMPIFIQSATLPEKKPDLERVGYMKKPYEVEEVERILAALSEAKSSSPSSKVFGATLMDEYKPALDGLGVSYRRYPKLESPKSSVEESKRSSPSVSSPPAQPSLPSPA